jgi:hypothetical protein
LASDHDNSTVAIPFAEPSPKDVKEKIVSAASRRSVLAWLELNARSTKPQRVLVIAAAIDIFEQEIRQPPSNFGMESGAINDLHGVRLYGKGEK